MANQITKLVFRRGLRQTGKTVILNAGEPGWYTDTQRLYVGNGTQVGGVSVSTRNYGIRDFATLNFNLLSGAETGDFLYDDDSNLMYFLTGTNGALRSGWAEIDFVIKVDNSTVEFNTSSALQVKNYGIMPIHINSSNVGNGLVGGAGSSIRVNPDNSTIDINNNQVRLKPGSVPISYLGSISPFTILGNTNNFNAPIEQIFVGNGQVLGRYSGVLGPIDFSTIVSSGGGVGLVNPTNGITGSITLGTPSTINIGYDAAIIDTTTPTSIQLKRNIAITGNCDVSSLLRVQGDIIAFYTSDERAKTNIEEIKDSLTKIDTLRGVEFDWKKDNTHDIGVIAQDVQKVIPEATSLRTDGFLGVNYDKIIPLLINCIKELKQEVKQLKDEIKKV